MEFADMKFSVFTETKERSVKNKKTFVITDLFKKQLMHVKFRQHPPIQCTSSSHGNPEHSFPADNFNRQSKKHILSEIILQTQDLSY